jgi:toxin-antitoxin system PIN domain toxin
MISIDTNILFYAYNSDSPPHQAAYKWLESIQNREDVAISEFILVEFYCLLRNPSVLKNPLSAEAAVGVIQEYRQHPKWRIVGFPLESRNIHTQLWKYADDPGFAFRKIYDSRTALTLLHHGVTEFATRNIKDFRDFDFQKVWDPTSKANFER